MLSSSWVCYDQWYQNFFFLRARSHFGEQWSFNYSNKNIGVVVARNKMLKTQLCLLPLVLVLRRCHCCITTCWMKRVPQTVELSHAEPPALERPSFSRGHECMFNRECLWLNIYILGSLFKMVYTVSRQEWTDFSGCCVSSQASWWVGKYLRRLLLGF